MSAGPTTTTEDHRDWRWPLVVGLGLILAAVVTAQVLGGDAGAVTTTLTLILGAVGTVGGVGGALFSRQAAKQTNGVLDERMRAAVERGIAAALDAQPPTAGDTPGPALYGSGGTAYPRE